MMRFGAPIQSLVLLTALYSAVAAGVASAQPGEIDNLRITLGAVRFLKASDRARVEAVGFQQGQCTVSHGLG